MAEQIKKLPANFYRSTGGAEPVRDWLKALNPEDRRIVGGAIARADSAGPSGCRCAGLWAAACGRSAATSRMAGFCISQGGMVLLRGFEKKSQATPQPELELARKRQKEIEQ